MGKTNTILTAKDAKSAKGNAKEDFSGNAF